MKKLFLFILTIILFCGCEFNNKEKNDYKHYTINDENIEEYVEMIQYTNDDGIIDTYLIAIINEDSESGGDEVLLYKVKDKDYIYLYKIYDGSEFKTILKDNKLYIINILCMKIYTLDQYNTKEKEIIFSTPNDGFIYNPKGLLNVNNDYVYYPANVYKDNIFVKETTIQCSLIDYKCVSK